MNWDDLKLFLAVSRTGSMSGAAKQFNVQHSTVSRRVHALEKKLGVSLLERKKGTYQLTPAGTKVKRAAARIESEVIGVDGTLLGKNDSMKGSLRVTTISYMASSILAPMFSSFCKIHPGIDLHIMVSNDTASLSNREADIAIRLTNSPAESLIGKRLVTVASTAYGSSDYFLQQRQKEDDLKWIGANCCSFHKTWTKQACGSRSHQFNCDDMLVTQSAIREGFGVSFLPCFLGDVDAGLVRYSDPDPKHDLGLWILMHPELKYNARVVAFRNHLIAKIEEQRHLIEGLKMNDE